MKIPRQTSVCCLLILIDELICNFKGEGKPIVYHCGIPPINYDIKTQKCEGGEVVSRENLTTLMTPSTNKSNMTSAFDNKNSCCGINGFTCPDTIRNDITGVPMFKKKNNFITMTRICSKIFVFFVKIRSEKIFNDAGCAVASITQYERQTDGHATVRKIGKMYNIKVPFTKNSFKLLKRKEFLIFSNYNYLTDSVFIRRDGDVVFKAPSCKCNFLEKLRQVNRICDKNTVK